jgi:hypothetical protein
MHLENGRCTVPDLATFGGLLFDPDQAYVAPPLTAVLEYAGAGVTINGAITSSYGMDSIEVRLDPAMQNQPLTIRFRGKAATARFHVQVWKLAPGGWKPRAVTGQPDVMVQTADGAQIYTITSLDIDAYNGLALIITRIDSDETIDPMGNYRVVLEASGQNIPTFRHHTVSGAPRKGVDPSSRLAGLEPLIQGFSPSTRIMCPDSTRIQSRFLRPWVSVI